ncbi:alpha/beta fold hydrolase [Fulvivirga lutea]|uniref:Alpha/beta hydrolase n=1 Tax=Fulvivirga lutea TaxID=2810512 RepID=A0A974ZZD8_9BACT|nr:alpha/beta hydrolase [Fulvivirga lutea]QSE95935.1 alpha/beta hydrolase [Fulvivirga lutea]
MIFRIAAISAFVFLLVFQSKAQKVKEFFHVKVEGDELPVYLRGNTSSKKIIIFVQGGPGENAIDFGRSNYPYWKESLEKEVFIAYYDQRGLNKPARKIDQAMISYHQYGKDILALARYLKEKYKSKIYVMGHSAGGDFVSKALVDFPDESQELIEAVILSNTPLTADFNAERYQLYRPTYLKNLAKEKILAGQDDQYWQVALDWIESIDSLQSVEHIRQWNKYVNSAFEPTKRKITPGMVFKVIFSRPYNPIKYIKRNDNDLVDDLLWEDRLNSNCFELYPKIQHNVLLISGRYDDIAPPEEMADAQKLIRNSKIEIIPNAGHESFLDQPNIFNKLVLEFIKN